jgi:hypothetical protein
MVDDKKRLFASESIIYTRGIYDSGAETPTLEILTQYIVVISS